MRRLNTGVPCRAMNHQGKTRMNKTSRARLILTDFAASLLVALSIGVAISFALAGAVVLIAQQAPEVPAPAASIGSPQ
jgi:hypothetical protein